MPDSYYPKETKTGKVPFDAWGLNREPSRSERVVGVVLAIFMFMVLGFVSAFIESKPIDQPWQNVARVAVGVAALAFGLFGFRAAFAKGRKPTPKTIRVAAYMGVFAGIVLIILGIFAGPELPIVSVGFSAVGAGLHNLSAASSAR